MAEVRVYTTRHCGSCVRAKALLDRKGIEDREIDVSGDPEARRSLALASDGLRTVPQVFVGELHVGGYDRLSELDRRGDLDRLLGS